MKIKFFAVGFISILLLFLVTTNGISDDSNLLVVKAFTDDIPEFINEENSNANITIQSPESRKKYNQSSILLNFTIETDVPYFHHFTGSLFDLYFRFGCFLDSNSSKIAINENDYGLLTSYNDVEVVLDKYENGYIGNARLENLSEGLHEITVLIKAEECMISYGAPKWSVSSTILFKVDTTPPSIQVISPEPRIYKNSEVMLNFTIDDYFYKSSYILDENDEIRITKQEIPLSNLADGNHSIRVYSVDDAGNIGVSETVNFFVDTPPNVAVLLPQNVTYNSTSIPLNFTLDQLVKQISYSLDAQNNLSIAGNTTITDLPSGSHNLTVYAIDETDNIGASETIYFTMHEPTISNEDDTSSDSNILLVSVVIITAISIIVVVYIWKRKH